MVTNSHVHINQNCYKPTYNSWIIHTFIYRLLTYYIITTKQFIDDGIYIRDILFEIKFVNMIKTNNVM